MCVRRAKLHKSYQQLQDPLPNPHGELRGPDLRLGCGSEWGVFYTDGTVIQYYLDTCAANDNDCMQTGEDLLPGNAYTGYQFAALAICNTLQTPKLCKSTSSLDKSRLLYVASLIWSNIYVLEICHQEAGLLVDAAATVKYSSLVLVAGRSWAGFADGVFSSALFNQPVDIELNTACSLLYISDFGNNRIRLMNLTAGTVSTAVGSGQSCWKAGLASCNPQDAEEGGCNPLVSDCASLQYPMGIGLSEDESLLYIAANTMDALYQLQTQAENGKASLSVVCSFSFDDLWGCTGMLPQFGKLQRLHAL